VRGSLFNDFMVEFDDCFSEQLEYGGTALGQVIVPTTPCACAHSGLRPKPAISFQPFEQRIERAWTDVVAMPSQLAEHPLADDGTVCGMVKDVHLPKAQQNLPRQQLGIKRRHSKDIDITTVVNECCNISERGGAK
jgi:hypothetical protein